MAKIQINLTGSGGLISSASKNPTNLVQYGGDDQLVDGLYNPFAYPTFMSPGRTYRKTLTLGGSATENRTCIYDPKSGRFIIGSQEGYINVFTTPDDLTYLQSTDQVTFFGLGATTLPTYDFEIYQLNGVRKIFYTSYNVAAGTSFVGITDGTNVQYNWSNTAANAGLYTGTVVGGGTFSRPLFLRTASNNFMYIFETGTGAVHKVDGTTTAGTAGTITANVLTIPNKAIGDAVDWRNTMYIAVQDNYGTATFAPYVDSTKFSYNCGVFVWDRVSTVVGTRDYIPLEGVKTINRLYVSHDGKLRIICVTSSGLTQLREFNNSTFEIIYELGSSAAPQWWDSVTFSDYATFWLGQDKYIYAHGKPTPGHKNGVYKIGYLTSGTISSGFYGFLYYLNISEGTTEALICDYKDNTSSKTQKILFNYSSASNVTNYSGRSADIDSVVIKTKSIQLPPLSSIKNIKVYFAPITGAGSSSIAGYIKIYTNLSLSAYKTISITQTDLVKGFVSVELNKDYINSIQIGIDYTASAVNVNGIASDMMPWYAILDYQPTKALK